MNNEQIETAESAAMELFIRPAGSGRTDMEERRVDTATATDRGDAL